jgi:hypothetical protein
MRLIWLVLYGIVGFLILYPLSLLANYSVFLFWVVVVALIGCMIFLYWYGKKRKKFTNYITFINKLLFLLLVLLIMGIVTFVFYFVGNSIYPYFRIAVGKTVLIDKDCFGAKSENAFNEMKRYKKAGDSIGINELLIEGNIYQLSKSDTALILSKGRLLEIRLVSGNYYSKKVFIDRNDCVFYK